MSGLHPELLREAIELAKVPDPPECFFTGAIDEPCRECGQAFRAPRHTWPKDRPFYIKVAEAHEQLIRERA